MRWWAHALKTRPIHGGIDTRSSVATWVIGAWIGIRRGAQWPKCIGWTLAHERGDSDV